MRESIKIKTDDYNFKFRVSGLIIRNNKLLLVDMDDSGFLCLPGGYVELGETTEEAVKRELVEEIAKRMEWKDKKDFAKQDYKLPLKSVEKLIEEILIIHF